MEGEAPKPKPRLVTVVATLPPCPACGAKDQSLKISKTRRPYGSASSCKVQYAECECGVRFKIEWE